MPRIDWLSIPLKQYQVWKYCHVSIQALTILPDIYGYGGKVRKSQVYDTLVHRTVNTLTMRDKKQHAQRRRIMSHGFSDAAIRSFEPRVKELIRTLCDLLIVKDAGSDGEWSAPQDMAKWCKSTLIPTGRCTYT